jgi:hypothetical protein
MLLVTDDPADCRQLQETLKVFSEKLAPTHRFKGATSQNKVGSNCNDIPNIYSIPEVQPGR